MTFQGTVPVKKALQLSLNVPAIVLLDRVGSSRLASRLRQAGGNLILPKDEAPGLAMGLGGVGVTLQDLAQLYAGFARPAPPSRCARSWGPPTTASRCGCLTPSRPGRSERAAGNPTAGERRPQPYRLQDRHLVRLSRRLVGRVRRPMTIGVWVGRPDGAPVPGLIGRVAAAPILFDAFARTGKTLTPLPKPPGEPWSPATRSCHCH